MRLSAVDILPIHGSPQGRLAVQLRNDLIYNLTGSGGVNSPTHRLKIRMVAINQQVIVDHRTTRPDVQE